MSNSSLTLSATASVSDVAPLAVLQIGGVLRIQQDVSKELLEANVETISGLAPFVTESTQAHSLVDIASFLPKNIIVCG